MSRFFVDTNFFLECRKPDQLPWADIGSSGDVELFVPSVVIQEIERNKTKGNSRVAKRAREASALFRRMLDANGVAIVLQENGPKITIEFGPIVRINWDEHPNLDENKADHQIVAEVGKHRLVYSDVTLLSNDTLVVLAARDIGLQHYRIPEAWKLPPENDERDTEIMKLRDENRVLKNSFPDISIEVTEPTLQGKILELNVEQLALTKTDLAEAVKAVKVAHPMQQSWSAPSQPAHFFDPSRRWMPPSDNAIQKYKADYPEWLERIEDRIENLSGRWNNLQHESAVFLSLSNNGHANALSTRLQVSGFDGVLLLPRVSTRETEERGRLKLPDPPKAPEGKFVSIYSMDPVFATGWRRQETFPHIPNLSIPEKDPQAFYLVGDRPRVPVASIEWSCDAMPHQADEYTIGLRLVVDPTELGESPRIRVRLTASNLPKPQEIFIPLAVSTVQVGAQDWIQNLLRKS